MRKAILFFKENTAIRYGLPPYSRSLSGDIITETEKKVVITPLRCRKAPKHIFKEDLSKINYLS